MSTCISFLKQMFLSKYLAVITTEMRNIEQGQAVHMEIKGLGTAHSLHVWLLPTERMLCGGRGRRSPAPGPLDRQVHAFLTLGFHVDVSAQLSMPDTVPAFIDSSTVVRRSLHVSGVAGLYPEKGWIKDFLPKVWLGNHWPMVSN